MNKKRINMKKIKEVLRLKNECNLSYDQIAKVCNISKGTVSNYLKLATLKNLKWPPPEDYDDYMLYKMLFEPSVKKQDYVEPDLAFIHNELKKKGVTLHLLWEEYSDQILHNNITTQADNNSNKCYSYARYCHLYHEWCQSLRLSMRQKHLAGEKAFIDYSGQTIPIINRGTGEISAAEIFIGVLSASSYIYAEATDSQKLHNWIASQIRMLEYFGGVPEILIPDNLKSAVTTPCRYDPVINLTYSAFAKHYNVAIIPARSYKPKDKASVENSVLIVQRHILSHFRNVKFFSIEELNIEIKKFLVILNNKKMQKLNTSRLELFETVDKPALKTLPPTAFIHSDWYTKRVGLDYHVEIEKHYYSVPNMLAKEKVDACVTSNTVEIFYNGKRVASHIRCCVQGGSSTDPSHLTESHKKYANQSPAIFLNWSNSVGIATHTIVNKNLDSKNKYVAYKICSGIMSLAKKYGNLRTEKACTKALQLGVISYRDIKAILKNGTESQVQTFAADIKDDLPTHENVRGATYYAKQSSKLLH
jgi:transposase